MPTAQRYGALVTISFPLVRNEARLSPVYLSSTSHQGRTARRRRRSIWHNQRMQIRQGLTLDGSNPEDEALLAAYVGELQRLAALKGEALRAAHRRGVSANRLHGFGRFKALGPF
jgi:hypothetical protein